MKWDEIYFRQIHTDLSSKLSPVTQQLCERGLCLGPAALPESGAHLGQTSWRQMMRRNHPRWLQPGKRLQVPELWVPGLASAPGSPHRTLCMGAGRPLRTGPPRFQAPGLTGCSLRPSPRVSQGMAGAHGSGLGYTPLRSWDAPACPRGEGRRGSRVGGPCWAPKHKSVPRALLCADKTPSKGAQRLRSPFSLSSRSVICSLRPSWRVQRRAGCQHPDGGPLACTTELRWFSSSSVHVWGVRRHI